MKHAVGHQALLEAGCGGRLDGQRELRMDGRLAAARPGDGPQAQRLRLDQKGLEGADFKSTATLGVTGDGRMLVELPRCEPPVPQRSRKD